jgi:hypothetical protein
VIRLLIIAAAGALVLLGCAAPDPAGPQQAASAFTEAVSRSDGGRACSLLAPAVASAIAESSKTACSEAVLREDLPAAAPVRSVQRFGRQALVITRTDTVFLSEFPTGWKIIGAGCTPPGDLPSDCAVAKG